MGALLVRHEPCSVAVVRRELAADLANNGLDQESVDDVTLVASELVGNAVRHATLAPDGDLNIAWTISPTNVLVSVADASSTEPQLRSPSPRDPAGRGLAIVDTLASTWGVEQLDAGKRVWARVPIEASVRQAAHHP